MRSLSLAEVCLRILCAVRNSAHLGAAGLPARGAGANLTVMRLDLSESLARGLINLREPVQPGARYRAGSKPLEGDMMRWLAADRRVGESASEDDFSGCARRAAAF